MNIHVKYQSSTIYCSKVFSKVNVSDRVTELWNDRMTDRIKTTCPPIFHTGDIKIEKQEAHSPHHSPEKHFQSINTFVQIYDYTMILINYTIILIKRYQEAHNNQLRNISKQCPSLSKAMIIHAG